ncbi:DUF916 and DUF3324 domain-containing protein [Vagococcus teuberi]|uniref:Uncharacterized protein n=1 Tax=Vagococcus teuberi TaxID=519472 RepID=A0A1J0A816_9ENTE|nr:DUF916 and DUF3324 domain-containing protein [Vagococcus teuberi]APB32047.1 hypothetical protein BHY08_09640 [Vagococcus teuberi]
MFCAKRKATLVISVLFILFFNKFEVLATDTAKNSGIGYSIQKISPGNEIDETNSFYDIRVVPGEKKKIEAKIINPTKEEITVKSQIFSASTNDSGDINYTSENKNPDKTLIYPLSDIVQITSSDVKITIPPNDEKVVSANIVVPKGAEDGVILGSWYFEKLGQENAKENKKGITINNKYSYALAIKLTVNKEVEKPALELIDVNAELKNYQKVIVSEIRNEVAAVVSKLDVSAEIVKKNSNDTLYKNEQKEMIMAPNSTFKFPVYLGEKQLIPGEYTMKMNVRTSDSKWQTQKWDWEKDFTITKTTARQLNENAINDPKVEKNWFNIIVIVCLFLIIIFCIVIYTIYKWKLNQSKIKKRNKKMKKNKKSKTRKHKT